MFTIFIVVVVGCAAGSLIAYKSYQKGLIQKAQIPGVVGLVGFAFFASFLVFMQLLSNSGAFPKRRIVTDGVVFEVESQYYPFSEWYMTNNEYGTKQEAEKYILEMKEQKEEEIEHEQRDWKKVE